MSKGLSTDLYRLQYYDGMCIDKMCEGGPRRPGWAPGQHWAKERLGEKAC